MKLVLVILIFTASLPLLAQCIGEAQLSVTKVKKIAIHSQGCRIIPERGVTESNPLCPFDDSGIMNAGIEVGLNKDGECNFQVGSSISGYLINTENGIQKEGITNHIPAQASQNICAGEAQLFPTKVKSIVVHEEGCLVIPERGHTESNPMCPFDDSSIMSRGIEVGVNANGVCNYAVGSSISGYVINTSEGIELEGIQHRIPANCGQIRPEVSPTVPLLQVLPHIKQ